MSTKAQRREKKRQIRELLQLRRTFQRLSGLVWNRPLVLKSMTMPFDWCGRTITEPLSYEEEAIYGQAVAGGKRDCLENYCKQGGK